jgi:hypothetical protein
MLTVPESVRTAHVRGQTVAWEAGESFLLGDLLEKLENTGNSDPCLQLLREHAETAGIRGQEVCVGEVLLLPKMLPKGTRLYDLTVEGDQSFVAEGLAVHNCQRLPGTRTAAKFGKKAITAQRHLGESWKECYYRTCVTDAPQWLAERSTKYAELRMRQHKYHSNEPLPEVVSCATCYCNGSWKALTKSMFMGDPLSIKDGSLPYVQPGQFREGAENWFKKNKKSK